MSAVPPTLIESGQRETNPLLGSVVAYWSPAALQMNGVVLHTFPNFIQTPPLFCAGLNSFTLLVQTTDSILGNTYITTEYPPNDSISTLVDVCQKNGPLIGGAGSLLFTFGGTNPATPQDYTDGVGPGQLGNPTLLVWWVFSIAFDGNPDPADPEPTLTCRLWGARR